MWSRHRPDASLSDIALAACALLSRRDGSAEGITRDWFPSEEAVACLSVRSGFDLLLRSMTIAPGDEVLFTEVTIQGMVRITEAAGAVVRSVPVDRATLAPTAAEIAQRLTPRTRAIVLAPLFGSRYPIGPLAEAARRYGALVVEDAAQAFDGKHFAGSPEADVTMFSFGMIKRATAGGGAVLRVRDPALRSTMLKTLATYPKQPRKDYARRLAMLTLLRVASHHWLYGLVYRLLSLCGDADQLVSNMGKTRPGQQSLDRLRCQPGNAMLRMIERRVQQHDVLRPIVAEETMAALGDVACGARASTPPRWVLPVTVDRPASVTRRLLRLGYDSSKLSSLIRVGSDKEACVVSTPGAGEAQAEMSVADETHWLDKTLFLPTDDRMTVVDRERMIRTVLARD